MRKTWFAFCLAMPVLVSLPGGARATEIAASKGTELRRVVERFMRDQRVPGGTVAISVNGQTVWSKGFGQADVEDRAPATVDTAYRTASMGKPMAATIAFMLAREGKLDFSAPVQRYCPRYPQKHWPIAVRDLISHTSGIREPNDAGELYNTRHYEHASDAVALFANDPLRFEPGTDFGYTTWGYVLLGCVLEGASGEDLRTLFRKRLFDPAGMTHTRDDDPREVIPNRARGYLIQNERLTVTPWTDMSHKLAAGGWVTTAGDMLKFMNAWMDGRLVSADDQRTMLTPYRLRNGDTLDNYGMGWFLFEHNGRPFAMHGGGTPGISAIEFMVPSTQVAVIAFFNLENIKSDIRIALATQLAELVGGFPPAAKVPGKRNSAQLFGMRPFTRSS
jgi:CubicO group peptidase (beta-lactamase class C family)